MKQVQSWSIKWLSLLAMILIGTYLMQISISPYLALTMSTSAQVVLVSKHLNNDQHVRSFICNRSDVQQYSHSLEAFANDSFDAYREQWLIQYCNLVPEPPTNWTKARSYVENDVAFVLFTGASFYHTRATAVRDTWLSRVRNYYFLSATPYPYLPVTVIEKAGEDRLSNMKKLFYGLQVIYQDQMNRSVSQRQKWFYIAGCDTFILTHHLLKRLDDLDYQRAILLGGHWGEHRCLERNASDIVVDFPSGGAGFFFSLKLLELMQPHLTDYVEHVWPKTSEISDVALACLARKLGVKLTKQVGFWAHPPQFTMVENGRKKFHAEREPNNFHYIKPDEMYALDEFYVHQYLDRLINDENWQEIITFTRRFIVSHYELLRKKRRECKLPDVDNSSKASHA
jgi:hypothetical protein